MWKYRSEWLFKKREIERIKREAEEKRLREAREKKAAMTLVAFARGWLVRKRTRALFRLVCISIECLLNHRVMSFSYKILAIITPK